MNRGASLVLLLLLVAVGVTAVSPRPRESYAQGTQIYVDIYGAGKKKINIAIPDFTVVAGADTTGLAKSLAQVSGADLKFTGVFAVVAGEGAIPANNPEALKKSWTDFAAAGAHAGLHGLLAIRGERLEAEMRLYDLTSTEQKLIGSKTFSMAVSQPRRLAHKIADEVMLQFTGEAGVADTKLAFSSGRTGAKEIAVADYDGFNPATVTKNGSINLTPVWSPDARSLAYTSYKAGYPDLYRLFPFEKRPEQTLRHQLLARVEPGRADPGAHALEGRQSRDLRPHAGHGHAPASHPSRRDRHRPGMVADRTADRVRLQSRGGPARVRHGRGRRERPADHVRARANAAALVAERRRDRVHEPRRQFRHLADRQRRVESAATDGGAGRQRGADVVAERSSSRVPGEPARRLADLHDARRWLGASADHARHR